MVSRLPEYSYWAIEAGSDNVELRVHAGSQDTVRQIRSVLPIRKWNKEYVESCDWWEYKALYQGVNVRLFACKEAPRTCRRVERKVLIKEQVGVEFEERMASVPVRFEE